LIRIPSRKKSLEDMGVDGRIVQKMDKLRPIKEMRYDDVG
jgi:hypothetical protein